MTSKWRQKCSLQQVIELLTEKTCRHKVVLFLVSRKKNLEKMAKLLYNYGKYFEWIIKQILNSAFRGYEGRRVLSPKAEGRGGSIITPPEICRILHILWKPWNSIIAKLYNLIDMLIKIKPNSDSTWLSIEVPSKGCTLLLQIVLKNLKFVL